MWLISGDTKKVLKTVSFIIRWPKTLLSKKNGFILKNFFKK